MKRFLLIICAAIFAAVVLGGCGAAESDARISIVATDFPCYDMARAIAGDRADITMLIKPGTEVHTFDPTPADAAALAEADVFVYIGGESDAWADRLMRGMEAPQVIVRMFDCVEAIEEEIVEGMEHAEEHDHEEDSEYDEHIWTSPVNAAAMVRYLTNALIAVDPENADVYALNGEAYAAQIEEVGAEIGEIVENAARNEMIFADRFPFLYLAREYSLTYYAAFPGCAAETEPSAKTMMFLIDRVIADKIPAVYVIEMSNGVIARTIADETGAEVITMHSVQNVTVDEFEAGETYVSIMRKNAEALRKGLN